MGFFSSIGGLFGGSKSAETQKSGFGALPKEAQDAFINMTKQASGMLLAPNGGKLFTPMPQTGAETQAFGLMQAPTTQAGVADLVGRFQNPYIDSLIGDINRQAEGKYSLYKQALSGAGQMGSNREFINAAAADEARLRAIEQAKRESYNTALGTGLAANQQTIGNLMQQGEFTRGLDTQTRQADLNALYALGTILGFYPQTSEGTSMKKDYGEGSFGRIAGFASGLFGG
jgi:hypothetical protein